MEPTVRAMAAEGRPYKGVLYAGLMIDRDQIKVLEFNARFGDPEAQPLLIRLKNDIVPIMEAIIDERLHECTLEVSRWHFNIFPAGILGQTKSYFCSKIETI